MQLLISGIILIMIDFIYLSLTLPMFKNMVKQIQKSPVIVRPGGVIASYILPIVGLNIFILKENKSPYVTEMKRACVRCYFKKFAKKIINSLVNIFGLQSVLNKRLEKKWR